MFRQDERDQVDVFENVEIDHEASNAWIGRFVAWIPNGSDHRILGIFAVPRISEIRHEDFSCMNELSFVVESKACVGGTRNEEFSITIIRKKVLFLCFCLKLCAVDKRKHRNEQQKTGSRSQLTHIFARS